MGDGRVTSRRASGASSVPDVPDCLAVGQAQNPFFGMPRPREPHVPLAPGDILCRYPDDYPSRWGVFRVFVPTLPAQPQPEAQPPLPPWPVLEPPPEPSIFRWPQLPQVKVLGIEVPSEAVAVGVVVLAVLVAGAARIFGAKKKAKPSPTPSPEEQLRMRLREIPIYAGLSQPMRRLLVVELLQLEQGGVPKYVGPDGKLRSEALHHVLMVYVQAHNAVTQASSAPAATPAVPPPPPLSRSSAAAGVSLPRPRPFGAAPPPPPPASLPRPRSQGGPLSGSAPSVSQPLPLQTTAASPPPTPSQPQDQRQAIRGKLSTPPLQEHFEALPSELQEALVSYLEWYAEKSGALQPQYIQNAVTLYHDTFVFLRGRWQAVYPGEGPPAEWVLNNLKTVGFEIWQGRTPMVLPFPVPLPPSAETPLPAAARSTPPPAAAPSAPPPAAARSTPPPAAPPPPEPAVSDPLQAICDELSQGLWQAQYEALSPKMKDVLIDAVSRSVQRSGDSSPMQIDQGIMLFFDTYDNLQQQWQKVYPGERPPDQWLLENFKDVTFATAQGKTPAALSFPLPLVVPVPPRQPASQPPSAPESNPPLTSLQQEIDARLKENLLYQTMPQSVRFNLLSMLEALQKSGLPEFVEAGGQLRDELMRDRTAEISHATEALCQRWEAMDIDQRRAATNSAHDALAVEPPETWLLQNIEEQMRWQQVEAIAGDAAAMPHFREMHLQLSRERWFSDLQTPRLRFKFAKMAAKWMKEKIFQPGGDYVDSQGWLTTKGFTLIREASNMHDNSAEPSQVAEVAKPRGLIQPKKPTDSVMRRVRFKRGGGPAGEGGSNPGVR